MIRSLQYRLAQQEDHQFLSCGPRYPTKETARKAASEMNRERIARGMPRLTHILTLPPLGTDAIDTEPSEFLKVDLL